MEANMKAGKNVDGAVVLGMEWAAKKRGRLDGGGTKGYSPLGAAVGS
jgi:hypothetical protein